MCEGGLTLQIALSMFYNGSLFFVAVPAPVDMADIAVDPLLVDMTDIYDPVSVDEAHTTVDPVSVDTIGIGRVSGVV